MANVTYTVKWGDTLSQLALDYNTTVAKLVELNDIEDPDFIVVGQVLIMSGTATTKAVAKQKPTVKAFGLQSNTDRTVYAAWTWSQDNTDHYEIKWTYATGDGIGFTGERSTTTSKQSVYTAPSNAVSVAFYVKPVSKKHKVNKKDVSYWTANWSTVERYYFKNNPPSTPPVPTVSIEDYVLTAELSNLDVNGDYIEFQVAKNDSTIYKTGTAKIKTTAASFSCDVDTGTEYKVRCRALRNNLKSDWSNYSSNVTAGPAAPTSITSIKALTETSVYLAWTAVSSASSYEIEYTTQKRYFDSSNETSSMTVESTVHHAEVTGLETGQEWFFRVRSVSEDAESGENKSGWTNIRSVTIGTKPSAPTTWSSTTTAIVGESVKLYWVHNAEDGSSQTTAELQLTINGATTTQTIQNSTDEEEKDKTSVYTVDTSGYTEGTKISWKVRTKGAIDTYSDWSIERTVDVYAPATLGLTLTKSDGTTIDTLESFPFYITGEAGPATQTPVSYHVTVTANEAYETVDSVGNPKMVSSGDEVFSKNYDVTDATLLIEMSANNIDLENNISYTVKVVVSMNSGLTAEATATFTVAWTEKEYWPNAEIGYDEEKYTTYIRPYCEDNSGNLISGVTLSVYRREFDGRFTELGRNLNNVKNTFITDPHPSLDYARYRVIATDTSTGAVSYYDLPGYPINEVAVIIQWDEKWSEFDVNVEDELEEPAWSGSLLRLPYNIDVSDSNDKDVSLVEYIGRDSPVSYYGTQLGQKSTWNVDIAKEDKDTLYALRRLAIWTGDVYVREPSGSGYWAHIGVSFSQKHLEVVIPVTLDITRVAGGA